MKYLAHMKWLSLICVKELSLFWISALVSSRLFKSSTRVFINALGDIRTAALGDIIGEPSKLEKSPFCSLIVWASCLTKARLEVSSSILYSNDLRRLFLGKFKPFLSLRTCFERPFKPPRPLPRPRLVPLGLQIHLWNKLIYAHCQSRGFPFWKKRHKSAEIF